MPLSRGVDPDLLAALAGPFHPVVLVRVDWPGGVVRVHSGLGDLVWDSATWVGVGHHGELVLPEEGAGMAAAEGRMRLGGLPDDLDDHLDAAARGRDVDVWFGVVTERAGAVLAADPVLVFAGYVDGLSDEEVATPEGLFRAIDVALGSGPPQRAATSAHHSYEDQITAFPGDTAGRWTRAARANAGKLVW
jgi:hypothetical protein